MEVLNVSADYLMGSDTANLHIQNITMMLKNQPPEILAFVEKLVRLCISNLPCEMTSEEGGRFGMNAVEKESIERLYLEMYDMLIAYARSNVTQEGLAEELVQEAFRMACMKPQELCASENPRGVPYP